MELRFIGDVAKVEDGIKILQKRLGFTCGDDGIEVYVTQREGSIEVSMDGEKAKIAYQEKVHFYRGLGLLIEKINSGEKKFTIKETPQFRTNGIMADCSRNAVMTVESIKKMLEIMAVMGLNMMMLYTEDTFEIKGMPYFGYMRGRYTYEELKECDDYAYVLGIEMIPCIQTLAHLFAALKWNYAPGIRDTDDILFVGEDATYEFIEEMIKSISAPFRSKRINIGMDEADNLGLGRYLTKHGYVRRFEIMNEHLDRVKQITRKYGLEPMIWSDMYFRLASKTGLYYDEEAVIPSDVIDKIPLGIKLIYWDYYHNNKQSYKRYIELHKEMKEDVIFAGGLWTWSGVVVNYDKAFAVTNSGLTACKEMGISEVFATMWGDNGNETNIFSALLGLQLYAEHGYSETVDNKRLKERFKACTGGDMDSFLDISKLDYSKTYEDTLDPSNPSKYLLWQDVLIGLFDKQIDNLELNNYYSDLAKKLISHNNNTSEWKFIFDVPAKMADVLSMKAEMGLKIKKAYDDKDMQALVDFKDNILPGLYRLVEKLKISHRDQWMAVYKPFGWEVLDMRYGGLLSRIDTAIFVLDKYINGEIAEIAELEAERLYFDGIDGPREEGLGRCNIYNRIVSASPLGFLN